ncbi:DUF2283 domain-containing protein [Amycolatopsis sp. FDAARGOS 1241]|uniref:DUF2283 domain-containing protein n=1 Tax=Amycolatopsis sp. FDAARGOS 1241 TaxID=2778070 RepID=UPI00194FFDB4|nr:DUF2283 domain-containing protein [Amycolatopsis sp. FDAARGOS 1241]QRP47813.1 DUF2283 domain-containing protein [Amycolatopsis sp. FDAARGOS 1241]
MANLTVTYDASANAAYVYFTDPRFPEKSAYTYPCDPIEVDGMINLDFAQDGRVLGVEVLAARAKLPRFLLDAAQRIDRLATAAAEPVRPVRLHGPGIAARVKATREVFEGRDIEVIDSLRATSGDRVMEFRDPAQGTAVAVVVRAGGSWRDAVVTNSPLSGEVSVLFLGWVLGVAEEKLAQLFPG